MKTSLVLFLTISCYVLSPSIGCSAVPRIIHPVTAYKKWGYQLQNYRGPYSLKRIKKSEDTIWVIDYSKDGSNGSRFKKSEILPLKKNHNIILSYISVGEAEDFRYYYSKMDKNLIVDQNINFPDNFLVKYWKRSWKDIFLKDTKKFGKSYFKRIIEAGFDGVYLDIIDGYSFFKKTKKLHPANEMVKFISEIWVYCKKEDSDFLIFVQNATELYRKSDLKQLYFDSIDGIGIEDTFYFGKLKNNNALKIQKATLNNLREFQKQGKAILSVDYVTSQSKVDKYFELAKKYHFIPLAAERTLTGRMKMNK